MKGFTSFLSVLLTLALPVAASCADAPQETAKKASAEAIKTDSVKSGRSRKTAASKAAANELTTSGAVGETMTGGGYTYARLTKDGLTNWVAFPTRETRVGETLSLGGCVPMSDFQSKSLNRTFDWILFCAGAGTQANVAKTQAKVDKPQSVPLSAKKSPGSDGAAAATDRKIKVDKASGSNAYTVAQLYAKSSVLNGKRIVVRGQVAKVSPRIMRRNWIHLQDGSGTAKQKNNDLVVTSTALPKVGEVLTFSGTLAKDKDFGSGYKYSVLIEKGSVQP